MSIEMFDVLTHDGQPRNENDRFLCYCCGAMTLMSERCWVRMPHERIYAAYPDMLGVCIECLVLPLSQILLKIEERRASMIQPRKPYRLEGSYQNRQLEHVVGMPEPEVGMGATMIMHTDRRAYTIIEVKSPTVIVVQADVAIRTDGNGMSDAQSYRFKMNPASRDIRTVRRNRYGEWKQQGGGWSFLIGKRLEQYDYSS